MRYLGVLFDMDGLLLDTERLALTGFETTAKQLGVPDIGKMGRGFIGLRADDVETRLRLALDGRVTFEAFNSHWDAHFHTSLKKGIPVKPGVIDLLEQLTRLGLPCAVATSTRTTRAKEHLKTSGIDHYFQSVTGGDQVTLGKPNPEIYHAAAASISLSASDCAAFEDSDPGTSAAVASGAITVQVPDINAPAPEMLTLGHTIAPSILQGARMIRLIGE